MLVPFSNKKNKSKSDKAEMLIQKGFMLIKGKLYKQALLELKMAMELDYDKVIHVLRNKFIEYYKALEYEACLSLGLVLLKSDEKNYELANRVGNCARRLHNYKQANNLYKQALRGKKNFAIAYLNLAASMGKVDKFDMEVKYLIEPFLSYKGFILPDYKGHENIVKHMTEAWESQPMSLREDKSELHKEIYKQLKAAVKDSIKAGDSISEKSEAKQRAMFNLGLFALSLGDYKLALANFLNLKKLKCSFEYLEMVMALGYYLAGEKSRAIDIFAEQMGQDNHDRYLNVNLGLLYLKEKNKLLAYKYFAISGVLLEKSGGYYSRTDILNEADDLFETGNLKKALPLYRLVISEEPNIHAMDRVGKIFMQKNSYVEAIPMYREILKVDPGSDLAQNTLIQIHDHYFEQAEELYKDQKVAQSIVLYERALSVYRPLVTLEKASRVYTRLKRIERAEALKTEYEEILRKEKELAQARTREEHVIKGKAYMKAKDFNKAIENFEAAFSIKMDKDVFVFLAHIYKGLKMQNATNSLVQRWKKKLDNDERERQYQQKQKPEELNKE